MSYNGVGLQTPRGSGTSGYVQRNAAAVKDEQVRDKAGGGLYRSRQLRQASPRPSATSAALLEHERKRSAVLRVAELRDRLEDEGVAEEEIEQRVAELRADAGAARDRSPKRPAYEPRYSERAGRPDK
ncbi:Pre-mRNA-splicing factor CWC21 [[Candida] zeylanoides]